MKKDLRLSRILKKKFQKVVKFDPKPIGKAKGVTEMQKADVERRGNDFTK